MAACGSAAGAVAVPPADSILLDGKILVFSGLERHEREQQPRFEQALAVRDGRIVFVGTSEAARAYRGPQTAVTELDGRLVIPGIVDGHFHGTRYTDCDLGYEGGTIPQVPANILLVKSIAVMGFNYGYYVGWSPHDARFEEADKTFALMERIRGWCEAGLCRPHVDRTFRLDQAAEAMRALLERSVTGRVAITL